MHPLAAAGGLTLSALLTVAVLAYAQEPATTKGPLVGENSFTEAQARSWLESAGYTHVANLVLGTDGVWRASARLNGIPSLVRLDYRGNVTKL